MIYSHKLEDAKIELTDAILRHSADESVIYKTVEGEPIYLGYFFPKDYERTKKYPTFLFIHGGGWASHKIFEDQPHWQGDYLGFLARYYADKGFLGISIDYRLIKDDGQLPGYGLIESYEDCCDAVDYVLAHAKQYGVDQENMYLLGESSGGHLAGAVAAFHYDRCYSFKKVFLLNAITDLNDSVWKKAVPRESDHEKLSGLSFEERINFLSPLYQADERLGEDISKGQRVESFQIEAVSEEGSRYPIYQGTTIGNRRICVLEDPFGKQNPLIRNIPFRLKKLVLHITSARDEVFMREISVY